MDFINTNIYIYFFAQALLKAVSRNFLAPVYSHSLIISHPRIHKYKGLARFKNLAKRYVLAIVGGAALSVSAMIQFI